MMDDETAIRKQWPLGVINFVFLWLFGLPMIYCTAVVLDQGRDWTPFGSG